MSDDRVDGLGLGIFLCAPLDVLFRHPPLGQVDVALVLVNPGGETDW